MMQTGTIRIKKSNVEKPLKRRKPNYFTGASKRRILIVKAGEPLEETKALL